MAPEVLCESKGSYNSKVDLWSIGICFYQMLFGTIPFKSRKKTDLRKEIKIASGKNLYFPKLKVSK